MADIARGLIEYGVKQGNYSAEEGQKWLQSILNSGYDPDQFALFLAIETGMRPQAVNAYGCYGIIQWCCLSLDTEILTTKGWKYYHEIEEGTPILSYNPHSRVIEEDTVLKKHFYNNAPTIRMHNSRFDFISTPNHRWIVEHYKNKDKLLFKETKDLINSTPYNILRSGYYKFRSDKLVSDEIAALAGWVFTDGYIHKEKENVVIIYQSESANPDKCKEIDNLINLIGSAPGKTRDNNERDGMMRSWRISGDSASAIIKLLTKDKIISLDTLNQLTLTQAELMYKACILGDGHTRVGGYEQFSQQNPLAMDGFQLLCLCINKIANINFSRKETTYKKYPSGGTYISKPQLRVCIRKNQRTETRKERMNYTPDINQDVWCVETNNSTWIARRNGKVTITGNSPKAAGVVPPRGTPPSEQMPYALRFMKSTGGGPNRTAVENYLSILCPAAVNAGPDVSIDEASGGKCPSGPQADIIKGPDGRVTKRSIEAGLRKNAENLLNGVNIPPGPITGTAASLPGQGTGAAGVPGLITGTFSREYCAPPYIQNRAIRWTGCPIKLTSSLAAASGFGATAPGAMGYGDGFNLNGALAAGPYNGPLSPGGFIVPIRKGQYEFTSAFRTASRPGHNGIDLAWDIGTPIFAAASGTIEYAEAGVSGFGAWVTINHASGFRTVYGHVQEWFVKSGQMVKQGEPIATVGNRGRSTGPHLHFEIHLNGSPLNPERFIRP